MGFPRTSQASRGGADAPSGPQYKLLARALMRDIESGRYPVGGLLPKEMDICRDAGMSRITVRAAMRELLARGLISRHPGIGTRVEAAVARNRFVHTANSVDEFLQALVGLRFKLLARTHVVADERLAIEIECTPGDVFLLLESLRLTADGRPICLSRHYVPEQFAAAAARMNGRTGSLAAFVANSHGVDVADIRQTFDAQNVTASEARLLGAKRGEAALQSLRWYSTQDGRLLLASKSLFPKGRARYEFRSRRESMGGTGAPR